MKMQNKILKRFDLAGKVAVITGGGGALCGTMADALGAMGVKVAVLDLRQEKADARAQAITKPAGPPGPSGAMSSIRISSVDAMRRSANSGGRPTF